MATNSSDQSFMDELTYTLGELNKAMDNVQYMAGMVKELDLAKMLKKSSKTNWSKILKKIDLEQISAFLQSPLIQQLISDPELLSLFAPDPGQGADNPHHNQNNPQLLPQQQTQQPFKPPMQQPMQQPMRQPMQQPMQLLPPSSDTQSVAHTRSFTSVPYRPVSYAYQQPMRHQRPYRLPGSVPTKRRTYQRP